MSCGVGCRHGSDPALLWLWRRPVATAPVRPLAWEPPYAAGAAQKNSKKTKQTNKQKKQNKNWVHVNKLSKKKKGNIDSHVFVGPFLPLWGPSLLLSLRWGCWRGRGGSSAKFSFKRITLAGVENRLQRSQCWEQRDHSLLGRGPVRWRWCPQQRKKMIARDIYSTLVVKAIGILSLIG